MGKVTPEMIRAGCFAAGWSLPQGHITNSEIPKLYEAMKALDPEIERMREALLAVKAYHIDANPTELTDARVCDLVCSALAQAQRSANR